MRALLGFPLGLLRHLPLILVLLLIHRLVLALLLLVGLTALILVLLVTHNDSFQATFYRKRCLMNVSHGARAAR